MKLELQPNGYYRGIEKGKEIYFYEMFGRTGHIKSAVNLTNGTRLQNRCMKSNQLGCSNPGVFIEFIEGPDDTILSELLKNYKDLCKQRNTSKEKVSTKKSCCASPKKVKELKTWKVFMTGEDAKNYPVCNIDAFTADEAKESYEAAYNNSHKDKLGLKYFWLKASRS
jgi:hypothetical protein